MVWSSEQITWWRSRQKVYLADRIAVEHDRATDLQRTGVQQEILQVLNSFLDGSISLKAFTEEIFAIIIFSNIWRGVVKYEEAKEKDRRRL